MRRLPWILAALALAAVLIAGPSAWGRLLLRAGFPAAASGLISAPRWQGVALYEAGDYAGADAAFARSGRGSTYNRGNSLALTGEYELAVAYYDAVLYVDPADADAIANRALIAPFLDEVHGPTSGALGKLGTETAPDERPHGGTYEMTIQALMRDRPRLARPGDTRQSVVAGPDWLTALPDDPGRYLKLRLVAEHARRVEAGTAAEPGANPW